MAAPPNKTDQCFICKKDKTARQVLPARLVRDPFFDYVARHYPGWDAGKVICFNDFSRIRSEYIGTLLKDERGVLSEAEKQVIESLDTKEIVTEDVNVEFDQRQTLGQRVADKVASFGGSWKFIFLFVGVMVAWIASNSYTLLVHPFDPYPYILLNLLLSCIAALQAPVIMMSQNRQEARDRMRSELDYQVNLKAELEIRQLNAKMDMLLNSQWQHLIEIQSIQTQLIQELVDAKPKAKPPIKSLPEE